ncbi:hypothetical protein GCM10027176_51010 [Actinoallomurus bryophytorum]|uniref:Homeodomain-like domain-containing protein n=1 Tax=Actinoallomurus bryophytorum TaxID=1490222 RepID=A0A543CHU0_9ACTN|nr:hypothetical protein [Actinoallomurus bryophytorum]TQL96651.1 hypothetical protein FB559_2194 [Actinoallomurus bryophytorum]
MSTETTWSHAVQQITGQLTTLRESLQDAPIDQRLNALALLHRSFSEVHDLAQHEAIAAARAGGWSLRRIATALNCSHEQVRLMIN